MNIPSCSAWKNQTTSPSPQFTSSSPTSTSPAVPTLTPQSTKTASPSLTPSLTATPTSSPTATPLPNCGIYDQEGNFYVLNDDVIFYPGPDGEDLDLALEKAYPTWSSFRQQPDWYDEPVSAGQIIKDASYEKTFHLNSAVLLVTVGLELNWEKPIDGDLYSRARNTGERLVLFSGEWIHPDNVHIRSQYPQIANGATYALYKYFDFNEAALEDWCEDYITLFEKSPKGSP